MSSAAPDLRRLDELVLDHLASQRTDEVDELATTGRFVRPYERVDIAPQRKFARTIPRARLATGTASVPFVPSDSAVVTTKVAAVAEASSGSFDGAWFVATDDALGAIEEPAAIATRRSWAWLAISVAAAAAAIATMYAVL